MHDGTGWHWGFGFGHGGLGMLFWLVIIFAIVALAKYVLSSDK